MQETEGEKKCKNRTEIIDTTKKDKCIQRLKKHRYENKIKREYFGKWSIISA
jgi:hypothetical protein